MRAHFFVVAAGLTIGAGAASAADLVPGKWHAIRLAPFEGVLSYTVEDDGFRVVANVAAGINGHPIRFVATLAPGQRLVISVPQALRDGPIEFEVARDEERLVVRGLRSQAEPIAHLSRTE